MPDARTPYLHGHHDSVLRSHRWRTVQNSPGYLLPRLTPGARVLDVGCGPGTITAGFASRVPGGRVVGIDAAAEALPAARAAAARQGHRHVSFGAGDACRLGFHDAAFDVVHAHWPRNRTCGGWPGVAPVGVERRRLVPHSAWRDPLPRLTSPAARPIPEIARAALSASR